MDSRIRDLPGTIFSGRRLTRAPLAGIRDPGDGRSPSAREPHRTDEGDLRASELDTGQGKGDYKVQACRHMLAVLAAHQIVTLPARRERAIGANRVATPVWTSESDP